ncbi:hypothetical protein A9Q91_00525 [Candidatus Gracilibacteria bacterium 28_42_T64]|nr:hypothetical protein A9Q91_00525 [Candidatus Gracilibacteria bacterium 28_42_T64]
MVILEEKFWESLPQETKNSFPVMTESDSLKTTDICFIALCSFVIKELPESNTYELMKKSYKNIINIVRSSKQSVAS